MQKHSNMTLETNKLWLERQSGRKKDSEEFAFSIDKGRLTNSVAVRRLQGKTQVMNAGEHDFFRTRLTHSLEVANIGVSICRNLQYQFERDGKQELTSFLPKDELIHTLCLAHDLGHPAFGHVGEKILNFHMRHHGGFEGNGQTLRLLSKLGEYYPESGYNMTRRTLLGVVKYPVLYKDAMAARWQSTGEKAGQHKADYFQKHLTTPKNVELWTPPKCLHDDEAEVFDWILKPLSSEDKETFIRLQERNGKFKTQYKSLDCSIMELADDISYAFHDLEDVLVMKLVNEYQLIEELRTELHFLAQQYCETYKKDEDKDYFITMLKDGSVRSIKRCITSIINFIVFKGGITYTESLPFEEPLLKLNATAHGDFKPVIDKFKLFTIDNVILTPELQTLEYKGLQILDKLFEAILANYQKLLPQEARSWIEQGRCTPERAVCDYLASMTDREAGAMYERMFTPSAGSVFQPVQ